MSDIDLLQSPVLRKEFPGLGLAFDATVVGTYLQGALFDRNCQRYTISHCERDEAVYVPGDCCILRYRVEVHDRTSERKSLFVVSGRVFTNAAVCATYLRDRLVPLIPLVDNRQEVAPFVRPVASIEPLHMAVYAFPIDAELPALAAATDARRVAAILSETIPDRLRHGREIEAWRVELVVYRRQYRAVLRHILDGKAGDASSAERSIVYGKLAADSCGALAGPITAALRQHVQDCPGALRFGIPEAFAWRPDLQLSLLESIPGEPGLIHRALKLRLRGQPDTTSASSVEEMIERCAGIAATIHGSGIGIGDPRPLKDELLALSRQIAEVQRLSPELGLRLKGWLDQVSARSGSPAMESRLCHGDFTPGQVLFHGGNTGLVDFDSVCQAEPALDVGQFLTYLRLACMKPAGTTAMEASALAGQLSRRFLIAYSAAAGGRGNTEHLAERSNIYKVVSLLRRSIHSWMKFKTRRVEAAVCALQEETSALPNSK